MKCSSYGVWWEYYCSTVFHVDTSHSSHRETVTLFDELSSLFAMDSNSQTSRELLDKVTNRCFQETHRDLRTVRPAHVYFMSWVLCTHKGYSGASSWVVTCWLYMWLLCASLCWFLSVNSHSLLVQAHTWKNINNACFYMIIEYTRVECFFWPLFIVWLRGLP